nr:uncharacterized protein LOC104116785 [Ipomoea batatas]
MATLQKFKLLATQCAVAGSPTRSPSASPVIHLRRRKTLRMLLSRGGGSSSGRRLPPRDNCSPDRLVERRDSPEKGASHKLKLRDLFVASPPSFEERPSTNAGGQGLPPAANFASGRAGGGSVIRRFGDRSPRPLSATIRQRLLRRAWRPVLVAIPE